MNLWLIPLWQQNGAALATLLCEAAVLVLQLRALGWDRVKDMGLLDQAGRPLLAGMFTFSWACFLVVRTVPFVISLILSGLAFGVLLLITGALSWKELVAAKDIFLRPKRVLHTA
jgi:hypothetical protein